MAEKNGAESSKAGTSQISSKNILIGGLNGVGAQVARNIITSAVESIGNITLLDHKNVTENGSCLNRAESF